MDITTNSLQSILSLNPGNPEKGVRMLIGAYGLKNTYDTFQQIMKSEYNFLSELYSELYTNKEQKEEKEQKKTVKKSSPSPTPAPESLSTLKANTVIKVQKEGSQQQTTSQLLQEDDEPQQANPPFTSTTPPKGLPRKEIKKWQKEQEEKKEKELREKGVNPESLLTQENLKKWVDQENRDYAQIARDIVGLPEARVEEAAKKFGMKSALAKRRAALFASKGGRL